MSFFLNIKEDIEEVIFLGFFVFFLIVIYVFIYFYLIEYILIFFICGVKGMWCFVCLFLSCLFLFFMFLFYFKNNYFMI